MTELDDATVDPSMETTSGSWTAVEAALDLDQLEGGVLREVGALG
jgi:hypothetical protein